MFKKQIIKMQKIIIIAANNKKIVQINKMINSDINKEGKTNHVQDLITRQEQIED